jgi:6-phosphogluconolactonase (cycloisomerase 2 family)
MNWNRLSPILGLAFFIASSYAMILFAAHSDGNVSTLALDYHGNNYNLTVTSVTPDCEGNPSWLTLDRKNRLLYCLDRGATSAVAGSLNSFSITANGTLNRIARASAPLSGVHGQLVSMHGRQRGYVSAAL